MICAFKNGVEMFCTTSKNDYDMYDQIYITKGSKKYILEIEESDFMETVYDIEDGVEMLPIYVSRTVFDLIVAGLDKRGFKRFRAEFY